MRNRKRRAHRRKFLGIAHAPQISEASTRRMVAPALRTEHGLGRSAGIAHRRHIGARAAGAIGAALVEADDEVGGIDDLCPPSPPVGRCPRSCSPCATLLAHSIGERFELLGSGDRVRSARQPDTSIGSIVPPRAWKP